ncbi:KpsF/GutQ family sugar-phosphate isomerase [Pelagibaculum spongiae]|uniref:Arabinose 5-phosphate isomerase n=1 Tax=Pelagibaculum spongiae TaxID=2080658 RepID=A0A2V1GZ67_9GAMM|nr:KpsF/GutQ family sugar-phosphate isomerase [Pelagibaculum spongiae]PVZ70254.1 KpsF/GutQ family sugar-phosphate isomerase [Pelagibaculum spongiae]
MKIVTTSPHVTDYVQSITDTVKDVFLEQAAALQSLAERVDQTFEQAIELILNCQGRVIVCGMGKSGLIGRKIVATFASTGTPSFFMHPGEAFHGDLGMVKPIDVLLLISYSGETDEVLQLLPSVKSFGVPSIAITGGADSTLAKHSDVVLDCKVKREVCPNNLAPTTSTTATVAIGDALAVALMKQRNFQPEDFAQFHPGGSLGRRLLTRVKDVMHTKDLPFVKPEAAMTEVLFSMTKSRFGLALVVDQQKNLLGVVSDGDLRRALVQGIKIDQSTAKDIMSYQPKTISDREMLADAEETMREMQIKVLVAVDDHQQISGLVEWVQ